MTVARYALGASSLLAVTGALAFGAFRWRARLLPEWNGSLARVAEAVLGLSGLVVVSEVLGSVGGFRAVPVLFTVVATGVGAGILAGKPEPTPPAHESQPPRTWATTIALVAIAPAAGRWIIRTAQWFHVGIVDVDSMTYHLPHAANFVQDGWLTRTYYFVPAGDTPYHPSNAEVVHAIGMLFLHRDTLSLLVNFGWIALFLTAAWAIGHRYGAGPLALLGAGLTLAIPLMPITQAGAGATDIVALALLLASIAIVVHANDRAGLVLGGLAAGLAAGTKLTVIVPLIVLSIGLMRWARRRLSLSRRRFGLIWVGTILITGGYWYVRNLVDVGNPVPALDLGIGSFRLPRPPMPIIDRYGYAVSHYVLRPGLWKSWFLPSFKIAFGVAWPALAILVGAGLILGFRKGRAPLHRTLSVAGLLSVVAYVFTRTTALGPPGQPFLFVWNLRYLMPAFVIGLLLLATDPLVLRRPNVVLGIGCPLVVFVALEQEHVLYPPWTRATVAGVVGLAALAVAARWGGRLSRRAVALLAGVVVAGGVGVGYTVQQHYLDNRYADRSTPFAAITSLSRDIRDQRVGVEGFFTPFPFYGPDLSNRVRYVGNLGSDKSFTDFLSCRPWRRAVNAGHYDYLVVMPPWATGVTPPATAWTQSDPAATVVYQEGPASVFKIDGTLDPSTCQTEGSPA